MVKVGDEVITVSPLWHCGVDVGGRLGVVTDTTGHIMVDIYEYTNNPVKCFLREVENVQKSDDQLFMEEIDLAFENILL